MLLLLCIELDTAILMKALEDFQSTLCITHIAYEILKHSDKGAMTASQEYRTPPSSPPSCAWLAWASSAAQCIVASLLVHSCSTKCSTWDLHGWMRCEWYLSSWEAAWLRSGSWSCLSGSLPPGPPESGCIGPGLQGSAEGYHVLCSWASATSCSWSGSSSSASCWLSPPCSPCSGASAPHIECRRSTSA